jgi:hypothetical protein
MSLPDIDRNDGAVEQCIASRFPNSSISNRCAASPKPLRPCSLVLTLKYPIAGCIVRPIRSAADTS